MAKDKRDYRAEAILEIEDVEKLDGMIKIYKKEKIASLIGVALCGLAYFISVYTASDVIRGTNGVPIDDELRLWLGFGVVLPTAAGTVIFSALGGLNARYLEKSKDRKKELLLK